MNDEAEMNQVREEIAQTVAKKELLKESIETGKISARKGLRDLAELDSGLSVLDSQFKKLWDESRLKRETK